MRLAKQGRAVLVFALFGIAACEIDEQFIVQSSPAVTVHAVLDPAVNIQEVLVEKTLTGSITIDERARYDSLDPVNTAGGVPIAGATVVITGPDGPVTLAERAYVGKPATYGQGRYLMSPTGAKPIRPGAKYTLSITTAEGVVVTGSTTVPEANTTGFSSLDSDFDRETDTLHLSWQKVPKARTYGVRVESPFGPYLLFLDSTHVDFPGLTRNFWADDLERLFIPGFLQTSTVFAADTNYYDYYRSRNDPFTGSGIINHLKGGIGVFGSSVTIDSRMVNVTQKVKQPSLEGVWQVTAPLSGGTAQVDNITLWVETDFGASASLSGSYVKRPVSNNPPHEGFAGARDGSRIELQFLNNQDIHSTYNRFIGSLAGDSIVGTYTTSPTRVVFKKKKS